MSALKGPSAAFNSLHSGPLQITFLADAQHVLTEPQKVAGAAGAVEALVLLVDEGMAGMAGVVD
ncbi:MAG TPA: hypothetical protein VL096_05155 [Pirellulaceae bacterium]|nr:hypothetical protein [Pirellulaceae bacterium]